MKRNESHRSGLTAGDELRHWRIPTAVKRAVETMQEKKAETIVILKLKGISQMTDYLVISQGNSGRQNKAIADAVQENLKKEFKMRPLGVEGMQQADWILVDYVDFVVNIFLPETRNKFALEKLWMDAKRYLFNAG